MTEPEPVLEPWWESYLQSLERVKRRKALRAVMDACRAAGLAERQRDRERKLAARARERREAS